MKKLNLGCGKKLLQGYDNHDINAKYGANIVFDLDVYPYPIKDNTYNYIFMNNVLEHTEKPEKVLMELHRILKSGGLVEIIVPHWHSFNAYRGLTHKHYFCKESFSEFIVGKENYGLTEKKFKVIDERIRPTKFGKMLVSPKLINFAALFVGHLIDEIKIKLIPIK